MTPERLAEIRDRVTYNPEDWPITIELVAHIDTITAENDRLKGEVERLKRLNTSLVYGHDIFKLAALRVESTLRTQRDALVTALEKIVKAIKYSTQPMSDRIDYALDIATAALALLQAEKELSK